MEKHLLWAVTAVLITIMLIGMHSCDVTTAARAKCIEGGKNPAECLQAFRD